MKQSFDIIGMTCSACSAAVNRAVCKLNAVNSASVSLMTNSMLVDYDNTKISNDDIINAVISAGYLAKIAGTDHAKSDVSIMDNSNSIWEEQVKNMAFRLKISIPLTIALMYIAMGDMLGLPLPNFLTGTNNAVSFAFIQFLIALPVIFINRVYYERGFKSLFRGTPNMDSLIAIGSTSAISYGVFSIFRMSYSLGMGDMNTLHSYHHNLYFESAVMILTLITLGKYLETGSKKKTYAAISSLVNLRPGIAHIVRGDTVEDINIDAVNVGDIIQVKLGEAIPLDGVILSGNAIIDEAAITGESIPIEKCVGDNVIGATINKGAAFTLRVTKTGSETVLSKIIELVKAANATKAPIESIADKISGIFVPIVIVTAIATFIIWKLTDADTEFALNLAISVLVISCPCALGLATPVAIMVGSGQGAKNGLLFKSAESLENMHLIDTIVFDKTGTLTQGTPVVTDIILSDDYSETDFLAMAVSLEQGSQQPLAQAIVAYGASRISANKLVYGFSEIVGRGVKGIIDKKSILAGNAKLMAENNIDISYLNEYTDRLADNGKTPVFFAVDSSIMAIVGISDMSKNTSIIAIEKLKKMGIKTIMLTGDNARTAKKISDDLKLNEFISDVLPNQKEEVISELKSKGAKVAMVGDGINDSPALVRADVGIAVGCGTDVAIDSADIVLMKDDLQDVVTTIELSRATIMNIKENLFWAFFYNIICIPLAAGVFYPFFGIMLNPMIASLAMSLSSIFVVSNALRLRSFRSKKQIEYIKSNISNYVNMEVIKMENQENIKNVEKTMYIDGMMCVHCKANVEKALNGIANVNAVVDLAKKVANIKLSGDVDDDTLRGVVETAGYTVTDIK